eukprot:5939880-Pyramimonas_sp.AAC.1
MNAHGRDHADRARCQPDARPIKRIAIMDIICMSYASAHMQRNRYVQRPGKFAATRNAYQMQPPGERPSSRP